MARVSLSKSQLRREKESLVSYRRYLPALDLKRQQLMGERIRARGAVAVSLGNVDTAAAEAGTAIPMLADKRINVDGLVTLGKVTLGTQNIAGVRLPVVEDIEIIRKPYGRMVRPHWVDAFVDRLAAALRLRIEIGVAKERLELIEAAVIKVTQRVNLFDKVLIPQTEANIRRILVYLGDAERAAVVGAKIAKGKREGGAAS
jgi:V/A-type H+-transporting ATPase subunit D